MINRAYCIDYPKGHEGYSDVSWGLTASDDPFGYLAHEPNTDRDNGTITPTAAASSIVYTPDESIAAMRYFYENLGDRLWGEYGFYDAFNLNEDWFATSYLAIDQGPIVCMIENYRSELLWDNFMKNEEIEDALSSIGFVEDSTTVSIAEPSFQSLSIYPNPASSVLSIQLDQYDVSTAGAMLYIYSAQGQLVRRQELSGVDTAQVDVADLPMGAYALRLELGGQQYHGKFIVER